MRRIGIAVVALAGLVLFAASASANFMFAHWSVTNTQDGNDFHMIIEAPGTVTHTVEKGPFEYFELVPQPDNIFVAKWRTDFATAGTDVKIGLGLWDVESVNIKDAFWTEDATRQDSEKLPGFKKKEGGSVTYILTNDNDVDLTIGGLQFLLNEPVEHPLSTLGYGLIPGAWSTPLADFTLPAGTELGFYLPTAANGMWQLTQFVVAPTTDPYPVWVMHEFNVDIVPEPGTIALLLSGVAAALTCCTLRRRAR